jgi:nitrogen fixation negative regulator NifL
MWSELSAQKPWSGKLLNRRKDGTLYLAELEISPVVDASGQTTHFVGMHRDITDLHRLERLVRNQKHLIESVVDAAPMAFALLDPNGRIILDNQEYKKLVSDLRVKEPAHSMLDGIFPAWRTSLASQPQQLLMNNREVRIDRAAGRARWLSVTSSIIDMQSDCADSYFCADGQPGLLLVIADITNLRDEQERSRASARRRYWPRKNVPRRSVKVCRRPFFAWKSR